MAIPALQTILERIDTWPEERQERLAQVATLLDAEDDLTISDEDMVEIERRMNNPDEPTISLEEFDKRFARWLR